MVTPDEIAAISLFAALDAGDRERLSRTAADISLAAGEYAVNEGDERALFAVLEGKIEVVKRVDGIERVLGARGPGAIFGEVPITLAAPFPSGFRAAEASRIMRLEPQSYYTMAAAAPDVAEKVGALARERIGGLQGVAAEAPKPRAIVLGDRGQPCSELRRFLDRNQITFEWVTPDAADAAERWGGALPSAADCQFVAFRTGRRS